MYVSVMRRRQRAAAFSYSCIRILRIIATHCSCLTTAAALAATAFFFCQSLGEWFLMSLSAIFRLLDPFAMGVASACDRDRLRC